MFCDESKGFWKRGGGGGEGVNPLVFLCSSLFSALSLLPLFLETSHSRESGPSCSQRLGLASSRLLLLSARVSAVYDIRTEERRAGGSTTLHVSFSDGEN